MPKIAYIDRKFSGSSLQIIEQANQIVADYQAQGYQLTLRQLYYQFVARDLIENTQKEYKRIGGIINDGRLAGLIDWRAIEDRTRNLDVKDYSYGSPAQAINLTAESYVLDKWGGQPKYVEVWVEKEAMDDIVLQACADRVVPHFCCRGYVSQSEMWGAAMRLIRRENRGKDVTIIHLGDHDPSGIDMTRDIQDRLRTFGSQATMIRIALNMDQVEQYQPPPNFAKTTDSRFADYMAEYGNESWELDALEPRMLDTLVRETIEQHVDSELWDRRVARQERERRELTDISAYYDDVLSLARELSAADGNLIEPDEDGDG
jgi:hypothetical protein